MPGVEGLERWTQDLTQDLVCWGYRLLGAHGQDVGERLAGIQFDLFVQVRKQWEQAGEVLKYLAFKSLPGTGSPDDFHMILVGIQKQESSFSRKSLMP